MRYLAEALNNMTEKQVHFVYGTVNDKDLSKVLPLLPKSARYYFYKAAIPRDLDAKKLQEIAQSHQLIGNHYPSIQSALAAAQYEATKMNLVIIGGSIFIVAEVL